MPNSRKLVRMEYFFFNESARQRRSGSLSRDAFLVAAVLGSLFLPALTVLSGSGARRAARTFPEPLLPLLFLLFLALQFLFSLFAFECSLTFCHFVSPL